MSDREAQVILTANNSQYNQSVNESTKATEKFNAALQKTSETATKINKATAKGLLKIGASEIAGLTALSAVAATLEKQTSNIQSNLALNKTSSQYNAVTASIRAMSREMPIARAEIAAMATAVSDLGMLSAKQIGGVSSTFNKMQVATGESGIGLANSMVQFQRAMGVAQPTYQTMNPYANSVTGLSARAGTSAQGIMDFAQSFAPAARVAGMSQSSVLGLSTAATRAGIDGQYAASTISQILNDITQLRYVNSPELGRYARALGMDSTELTRKTSGPEDQDKFLRNIMSRVVAVAQTEEGPSRLSMMNIDGLRARKALQGLASEPGGIEKWINQAQAGMTQPNVQTGFKAASSGLADQTIMLRNRATDVGQQLGTPVMEAFNNVAIGANKLAGALQPVTDVITSITSKLGVPLATLTMGAGALLAAWATFSKLALISRGVWNVGTQGIRAGITDAAAMEAKGGKLLPGELTAYGQRVSDKNQPSTSLQRTLYGLGGGIRGALPSEMRDLSLKETSIRGVDRTLQWFSRGTQDFYQQARVNDPTERYKIRLANQKTLDDYKAAKAAYEKNTASAIALGKKYGMAEEEIRAQKGFPTAPELPKSTTGLPLTYVPRSDTPRLRDIPRTIASSWVAAPKEAGLTGGHMAWEGTKAAGGFLGQKAVSGIQNTSLGGIGRVAGGVVGNPMVQTMAAMVAINALVGARGEYKDWQKKWDSKTGGIAASELDNLNEYNEKLGLATRSLQQFTKGLDEANPAKSDNVGAELKNNENVRDYGRNMKELVNERLATIKTVDQAKEWIASQGTMNADQWVLVMRDFSKVFKNNQNAFAELNKWVQENQKNGSVPIEGVGTPELTSRFQESAKGSGWRSYLGNWTQFGSPVSFATGLISGGDNANIRGNKEFQNANEFLVGSQASQAKTIGEKKDASSLFGNAKPTIDQQQALTRGEGLSQFIATANKMMQDVKNAVSPGTINTRRIALDQYMKAGASTFGLNSQDWSANAVAFDQVGGQSARAAWNKDVERQIREGAKNGDESLQALIDSGALPKIMSGTALSDQLPDLTVQTSSRQAVAGTSFEKVDEKTFDKYLGEGSLLGKGLLAAGTLSDTTDFENASSQLLEFAKRIDKNGRKYAGPNFETLKGEDLGKQFAILEEMKINNQEGTQGWNLAKAAQAKIQVQTQFNDIGKTSLEVRQRELSDVRDLLPQLNVDPNKQSQDLMPQLSAAKIKAQSDKQNLGETIDAWGVSRAREEHDWLKNSSRSWAEYYRQREYSQDDFHRSMSRSRAAFNRQTAQSEATFQRSLKYQQQDFNRSRQREEESYQRQKKYAAEDTAKTIGDPYNRLQLQMINDPASMRITMKNRLDIATKQNQNIDTLKGRGLSQEAINQLDLANFNNAQQTNHLVSTATDADIASFNELVANLTKQGGSLNEKDTGTIRAEKERDIALKQGLDDFVRNLKRTKIEHAIQVKWNAKEFAISVKNAEEDHEISLERAAKAQTRIMAQAAEDRQRNLERQTEDMFGFGSKGIDMLEKTGGKILGPKGIINTFAGNLADELNGLVSTTDGIVTAIDKALAKIAKGRAAWEKAQAQETARENNRAEAQARAAKEESQARIDSASKQGWDRHPPYTTKDGKRVVWSPMDNKYVDVAVWQRQYPGFQTAKLAAGGILEPKGAGHQVTVAEAGSAEAVIPLNARGIDFMSQFTKGVAREMVKSMPRTPVSASNIVNQYDHSQNVRIDGMVVESNDPRKFVKELQKEAQKKRAALYKS